MTLEEKLKAIKIIYNKFQDDEIYTDTTRHQVSDYLNVLEKTSDDVVMMTHQSSDDVKIHVNMYLRYYVLAKIKGTILIEDYKRRESNAKRANHKVKTRAKAKADINIDVAESAFEQALSVVEV